MFGGTTFGTCIKKLIHLHLKTTEEKFATMIGMSEEELEAIIKNNLFPNQDFINIIIEKCELKDKKSYIAKEILEVYRSIVKNGFYKPKYKIPKDPRNPFTKEEEKELFGVDESQISYQSPKTNLKTSLPFLAWFKTIQKKYNLISMESIKEKLMLEDEERISEILSGKRLVDEDFCARLRYMVITEEDAKDMDFAYQKSRSDFYNDVDIYKDL